MYTGMSLTHIETTVRQFIAKHQRAYQEMFIVYMTLSIIGSVMVVVLESVETINLHHHRTLWLMEWFFTILFTAEFFIRVLVAKRSLKYIFSVYGFIDMISIFPTYLALLFAPTYYLIDVRVLRLLLIFRVLKLTRYIGNFSALKIALIRSRKRVFILLVTLFVTSVISGTLIYVIEGPKYGFINIPMSIYWAIVTLTTVGYGDLTPHTSTGQLLAVMMMLSGYAVIAIPTGIFTVELSDAIKRSKHRKKCHDCKRKGHDDDAVFCKYCGGTIRQSTRRASVQLSQY